MEDEPESSHNRHPSVGKVTVVPQSLSQKSLSPTSTSPMAKKRSAEILAPSQFANQPPETPIVSSASNLKRRSTVIAQLHAPRTEVAGEEMKGLMSAVGSLAARGNSKDDSDGVAGMSNRLRLSRAVLPPAASSATVAPAPLPSRRLVQTNWMDKQRHTLAAYEYLCHVGEAQQWVEGCLDHELGIGVTELEDGMRDGIILAKLAQQFQGDGVVKKIYTVS
jgi:Ras GTPase-activating-like protein IQGAP2/3